MFTKLEKEILNATNAEYKYIYRDYSGRLYLKDSKDGDFIYFDIYNHIFKNVKNGAEPIYFRYPILDDIEREYLKAVFKPFAKRIDFVVKRKYDTINECCIEVDMDDGDFTQFPTFNGKKMYLGMEFDKHYTLEALGITYD